MSSSISPVPEAPPLDGSLLFSDLINFQMQKNPTFPIFVYANDETPNGTTEITFLEFGRAAHRIAHVLRPAHQGDVGQVVMLIANTDTILYHAALAGMSLAGLVPFLVSPRNSATAIADMMKKTNCSRIVTLHHAHRSLMEASIREESSAFPKPIAHSYKVQIHWLTQRQLCWKVVAICCTAPRRWHVTATFPPFWGWSCQLYVPIAYLVTAGYLPTTLRKPSCTPHLSFHRPNNILDSVRRTKCNVLSTVPTFLEQWATSKDAVENLKKMDLVVGDALCAAGVPIGCQYGGSEFGAPVVFPDRKDIADGDWLWMRFGDNVNVRWVPQEDDIYELQVLTYFVKHPTKDLWRISIINATVSGGQTMSSRSPPGKRQYLHPWKALLGLARYSKARSCLDGSETRSGSWLNHEQSMLSTSGRIQLSPNFRNKIWPMLRTPKGTVQKKATLKVYQSEIDVMYNAVEATFESPNGLARPSAWTADVLEGWLTEHARAISQGHSIDPSVDLFVQGFDSLSVTYLRNQLINALRKSQDSNIQSAVSRLSLNIIFENPTIKQLAARISSVVSEEKYSFSLNSKADSVSINGATNGETHPGRAVVLLTGSTGGLGSFLLSQLLENPTVERVYALNRPSSSTSIEERQRSAFLDKGNSLRFVFTSSVGSAQSWDREKGPFPEEVQPDPSFAVGAGYGEAKYVSERIIVRSGLHATSLRIGQIAGGPNGSWATTDWVPIIVKSSIALGALPDANGTSRFAVDTPPPALNLVNPRGAPWTDVMSSVRDAILKQKSLGSEELPMVPSEDWFTLLDRKAEGATSEDLVNIPAIKLLKFFRSMARSDQGTRSRTEIQAVDMEAGGMASFSTAKSQLVSKTILGMQPVGAAEARSWVQHWISKGFL
ncbi:hypothetical protein BU15DRAFT_62645 [Melanogaster broomeanus]|nr:hypothetical protein BU15DRAFT_62645 [Melanogaster broomeanus]